MRRAYLEKGYQVLCVSKALKECGAPHTFPEGSSCGRGGSDVAEQRSGPHGMGDGGKR